MRIEDMILCCIEELESRISWMLFQRIIVLVSLHHKFFCSFFPVYIRIIIFSPPLSLRPFQVKEKEHFCVKYLNVLKINCFFLLLNIITTKISSERTAAVIMKKKWIPLCLSTPTTWKPINPIHLQPHQNQLFTLMKSQNQNTGDL